MISRRQFLVQGVVGLGAFAVPSDLVRRFTRLAKERNEPLLQTVVRPTEVLYANRLSHDFELSLGTPLSEEKPPELTWEDWLEIKGVDPSDESEVKELLIDWAIYDPDDAECGPFVVPDLNKIVPAGLLDDYLCGEHAMYYGAAARAYHYLDALSLAPLRARGAASLGQIEFVEGPVPGSNETFVTVDGLITLSALQHRLNELDERVEIRVV